MPEAYDFLNDPTKLKFRDGVPLPTSPYGNFLKAEHPKQRHKKIKIHLRTHQTTLPGRTNIHLHSHHLPSSNITFQSHRPKDLVEAIKNFTSPNPQLHISQNETPTTYQDMVHTLRISFQNLQNSPTPTNPTDTTLLSSYYHIFNKFFFFSSLHNLTKILIIPVSTTNSGACITSSHRSNHHIPSTHACIIHLADLTLRYPKMSPQQRQTSYINTLLHEMIHAYLAIYSCKCNRHCRQKYEEMIGRKGHGEAWQDCAFVVEQKGSEVLGVRLGLKRALSLARDAVEVGPVLRLGKDVELNLRWGLSLCEVERKFEDLRRRRERIRMEGRKGFEIAGSEVRLYLRILRYSY